MCYFYTLAHGVGDTIWFTLACRIAPSTVRKITVHNIAEYTYIQHHVSEILMIQERTTIVTRLLSMVSTRIAPLEYRSPSNNAQSIAFKSRKIAV